MNVKTFQGRTMADALAKVKRQYGRDAVILSTRTLTRGGFLGFGGKPWVEITAARQLGDLPGALQRGSVRVGSAAAGRAEGVVAAGRAEQAAAVVAAKPSANASAQPDLILSEMSALKCAVGELVREARRNQVPNLPGALYETYQRLVANAVADELAAGLVEQARKHLTAEQCGDPGSVRAHLLPVIRDMVPSAGAIRPALHGRSTVVALVGPTGVGKTTTIAKLAANFCLREGRRVGLITLDTYRIAAVDQLRTYAQIIDVPLVVAGSPEQLRDAVAGLSHCDIILIDTAGRSQRDTLKIRELKGFFEAVRPHEIHLVLSTTCSEKALHETIERFGEVGIDRVIFTKLDEAIGFGVMLNCLKKAGASLSYVTTGQDVPEDISIGSSEKVAALVMGDQRESVERGSPPVVQRKKRAVG